MRQLEGLGRGSSLWTGAQAALDLLSVTAAYSLAGELGPNGPQRTIIKGLFVSECYAWRAWMGFQSSQVQTSFSLWERGRWQEKPPRGQEAASIQLGRGPLWNEHMGRGMNFRNIVVNGTLEIHCTMEDDENNLRL